MPRLLLALGGYLLLALLVWQTMSNDVIRLVTFAVLALFAGRTLLLHRRRTLDAGNSGPK
jgi:hypothetical protein